MNLTLHLTRNCDLRAGSLAVVAAAALFGALSAGVGAGEPPGGDVGMGPLSSDPFGVPAERHVRPASAGPAVFCDTGACEFRRVSEGKASAIVERLFREAGARLQADVDPALQGVRARLDGWDPDKKMGYEFLTSDDFEEYVRPLPGTEPSKHDMEALERRRAEALSHAERQRLSELAARKKAFVAQIDRERYRYSLSESHLEGLMKGMREKAAAVRNPTSREILLDKLRAKEQELATRYGEAGALRRLERDVRAYITWLRAQGAL